MLPHTEDQCASLATLGTLPPVQLSGLKSGEGAWEARHSHNSFEGPGHESYCLVWLDLDTNAEDTTTVASLLHSLLVLADQQQALPLDRVDPGAE